MKIIKDNISIVIVGNWNIHIFTPEWVASKIFKEEKFFVDVAINIGIPNRYTSETKKVMLIPSENNITIRAQDASTECLSNMEEINSNLIAELPVTPIKAFGINFSYIEDKSPDLASLFNLPDMQRLLDAGFKEDECIIQRSYKLDGSKLNMKISRIKNGTLFDFNFHYDVKSADEVSLKIKGALNTNKAQAETLLKEAYSLVLSEQGE